MEDAPETAPEGEAPEGDAPETAPEADGEGDE